MSFQEALDDISKSYLQDVDRVIDVEALQFAELLSDWWYDKLDIFSLAVKIYAVLAEKSALELLHGFNDVLRLKGLLPRLHCSLNNNEGDDFIAIIDSNGSRIYLLSQFSLQSPTWVFSTEGLTNDGLITLDLQLDEKTAGWAIQLLDIELKLRYLEIPERKTCMKALHRLVQKFRVLPPSLFLRNVVQEGQRPVSGGSYADIFKGSLKELGRREVPVCLKALRVFQVYDTEKRNKLLKEFCREAFLWTQLNHQNILPCFGVSMKVIEDRLCLVSPWMVNGNIMEFLELNPQYDRLKAIIGIACGLSYLHGLEPQLVHGDVKGVNILVTEDGRCCLADFGLCLMVETHTIGATATSSAIKGTARWLAPELLLPTNPKFCAPNKAARDIYAFACTILEIYTGKPPFADQKMEMTVMFEVLEGKRPARPNEMEIPSLDSVWEMMEECWIEDSHRRPQAKELVQRLESVYVTPLQISSNHHPQLAVNPTSSLSLLSMSLNEGQDHSTVQLINSVLPHTPHPNMTSWKPSLFLPNTTSSANQCSLHDNLMQNVPISSTCVAAASPLTPESLQSSNDLPQITSSRKRRSPTSDRSSHPPHGVKRARKEVASSITLGNATFSSIANLQSTFSHQLSQSNIQSNPTEHHPSAYPQDNASESHDLAGGRERDLAVVPTRGTRIASPASHARDADSNPVILADLDPRTLPQDFRTEGSGWSCIFNPSLPPQALLDPKKRRNLDISLLWTLNHDSFVWCVQFSPDGKYLATGCDWAAQIFDVSNGKQVCVLVDETTGKGNLWIRSVRFSPDGCYLATGGQDKQIRIWDIAQRKIIVMFSGHTNEIYTLDFTPDGSHIISGGRDGTVRIWSLQPFIAMPGGLPPRGPPEDPNDPRWCMVLTDSGSSSVLSVSVSPHGRYLAAGSFDCLVRIWDINTGQLLERLHRHQDSVHSVVFTPNGKGVISGSFDGTMKYWDVGWLYTHSIKPKDGSKCLMNFVRHRADINSVAVSHDSQWIISGSDDQSVQFWDSRNAHVQCRLEGHKNEVISVTLSPVGNLLASGSDWRVLIWEYTTS